MPIKRFDTHWTYIEFSLGRDSVAQMSQNKLFLRLIRSWSPAFIVYRGRGAGLVPVPFKSVVRDFSTALPEGCVAKVIGVTDAQVQHGRVFTQVTKGEQTKEN